MHQKCIVRMWMTKCGKPSSQFEQRSPSGTNSMMCSTHSLVKVADSPAWSNACHQAILRGPSLMMVLLEPQNAVCKHSQNSIYPYIYIYIYIPSSLFIHIYRSIYLHIHLFISISLYLPQWHPEYTHNAPTRLQMDSHNVHTRQCHRSEAPWTHMSLP